MHSLRLHPRALRLLLMLFALSLIAAACSDDDAADAASDLSLIHI